MAAKTVAAAVDFTRVYTSLGLGKETISALQAFRKRNTEARTAADQLGTQPTTLDIAKYRSGLKNQAVVDDAEKILKNFKPVTYNVNEWIKGVEMFEGKAVAKAAETVVKVNEELQNLGATLANIENARPFEEVTVDEVALARPEIIKAVETMVKKGKWNVPGYKEKFGDLSMF